MAAPFLRGEDEAVWRVVRDLKPGRRKEGKTGGRPVAGRRAARKLNGCFRRTLDDFAILVEGVIRGWGKSERARRVRGFDGMK